MNKKGKTSVSLALSTGYQVTSHDWFRFLFADVCRFSSLRVRASSSSEESSGSVQTDEFLADLKDKVSRPNSCTLAFFTCLGIWSNWAVMAVGLDWEQIHGLLVRRRCTCCSVAIFHNRQCRQLCSSGIKMTHWLWLQICMFLWTNYQSLW